MVRWLWASLPVRRVARAGQHRESALRALVNVTPEPWRRRTAGRKRSSSARMSSVRMTTMLGRVWAPRRAGWLGAGPTAARSVRGRALPGSPAALAPLVEVWPLVPERRVVAVTRVEPRLVGEGV